MDLGQIEPIVVEGRIRISYRWPAGRAGGRFLTLLQAKGRVFGLRCPKCRKVTVPPRPRCSSCRTACEEWVPVGPDGTVTTWTICRRNPQPTVLALIRLDGADTALLHRLVEVEPETIRSGMRVTIVLAKERRGHITDLAGFRPV